MSQSLRRKRLSIFNISFSEGVSFDELLDELHLKSFSINTSLIKRLFDVLFSFCMIIGVLTWLYPIIAILIKITSKGPVLFIQDRVGLNGNYFKCYKFRTMKMVDVKYMYTPTTQKDDRISMIGKFLRKTNLDEFPQFLNVLKGDMSIVGPRPHAVAFHHTYSSFIDFIDDRLLVKPGITGLAQIKGYRGDVKDFEENKFRTKKRITFDILYIKMWSFKLDLWIVYTTFIQMVYRKTNAH